MISPLIIKLQFLHVTLVANGNWYMAEIVAELIKREFDRGSK